jgi:DNA-directed RNA polymerase specialized sigma24 family protein
VLQEQPYKEIALQLRCSELVARKRVSRGLATLRNIVQEES